MRPLVLTLAAALACAAVAGPVAGRSFAVDDLLAQETFGATVLDPRGRWLVFERRDRYDSAPGYDYDQAVHLTLGRLRVVDARAPGPARALLADDPRGLIVGAFSPTGDRLAVLRVQGRSWRLGVVTMATGHVRWFELTPDASVAGRSLQWLDDRRLLLIERPDGAGPRTLQRGSTISRALPERWAAAASGAGSHSAFGSGRYLDVRPRRPPNRIVRLDVESGAVESLADGQFIDLEIAPDGRGVALLESGPDVQPRPDGPVRGPAGLETEAGRLSLLDLSTGRRDAPCPDCDISPNLLSWSPSGRRLLVFARGPDGLWTSGRLRVVEARRGLSRVVGDGLRPQLDFNPVTPHTAWLGEAPVVYARAPGGRRGDWYRLGETGIRNLTAALPEPGAVALPTRRTKLRLFAGGAVWEAAADGRARKLLAAAAPPTFRGLRFGAPARLAAAPPSVLWAATSEGSGGHRLIGFDALGRRRDLPTPAPGALADAAASGVAVLRTTDQHGVGTLTLVTTAGAATVAAVNRGWSEIDPPRVVPIPHAGPTGEALTSWVYLPALADPHAPAPLLVRPYLGARYATAPGDLPGTVEAYQNLRVLTGRGYAVLVPSLPNPPGGMRDPADRLADRLLGIVQAALDAPTLAGRLDANRIALLGHSFGGYSVMTAITQTNCFRAAIAMNGLSDFTGYWASLPPHPQVGPEFGYMSNWHTGVVEQTQPEFHAPPWADAARYVRNSPLYAADRIETPLLLIHGAQDGVPLAQSEAMYSALFRQGKDALLLVYWGALHMPTAPGDIRSVYDASFRFLDDALGPPASRVPPAASPGGASASGGPRPPRPPPTGCPSASRAR